MSREASVEFDILEAGSCTHPRAIVLPGSSFSPMRFPANVALITHPTEGVILFDTGYSDKFHELTKKLPEKLYAIVTPVTIDEGSSAREILKKKGIQPKDVKHVILSHFHADHAGGVIDFPNAIIHADLESFTKIHKMSRFKQIATGYLAALFPEIIRPRIRSFIENRKVPTGLSQFPDGYDIFGDMSAIAIALPGHSIGHWGLLLRKSDGKQAFLLGDATWTHETYKEKRYPSILSRVIFSDTNEYRRTVDRIHDVWISNPGLELLPCHCERLGQQKIFNPQGHAS